MFLEEMLRPARILGDSPWGVGGRGFSLGSQALVNIKGERNWKMLHMSIQGIHMSPGRGAWRRGSVMMAP